MSPAGLTRWNLHTWTQIEISILWLNILNNVRAFIFVGLLCHNLKTDIPGSGPYKAPVSFSKGLFLVSAQWLPAERKITLHFSNPESRVVTFSLPVVLDCWNYLRELDNSLVGDGLVHVPGYKLGLQDWYKKWIKTPNQAPGQTAIRRALTVGPASTRGRKLMPTWSPGQAISAPFATLLSY